MTTQTTRFFIYARKSTDDPQRQVRSIDDQLAELRELAQRENLEVVEALVEKQTAKRPGRPVFNKMIERIERGDADGILAWHPDRLSRNSLDAGRLIYLLDNRKIADLRFPTVTVDQSAHGKFMLAIMFGQSKYYVDNLSENIKRGQRNKLKNGIWPMVAPIGYLNDHRTRRIVLDPDRAPLIRQAFELYSTGDYTIDRLGDLMGSLGLTNRRDRPLSRPQYHRLLSNPLYYGVIFYSGESHEGQHEAIVSKKLFDRVQAVIHEKSKPKAPKLKQYLYRGLFRCGECGCFITTETQKGNNYLRCTKRVKRDCSQPYTRETDISQQIHDAIKSVAVPEDWIEWMEQERQKEMAQETVSLAADCEKIRSVIAATDDKLKRLMAAYLDQALSLDEYRQLKTNLLSERVTLKQELSTLEKNRTGWFEPAGCFLKSLREATLLTSSDDDTKKRDFFRKVGSNFTVTHKVLNFNFREPWKTLTEHGRLAQHNAAPDISDAAFVKRKATLHG
jgi:DNA invertase Pin-like site-specific DNA recombinase